MPDWFSSLLSPLAALVGAYLGSRAVSRQRYRDERRVEVAEKVLGLLYELQIDFIYLLDIQGIVGIPIDKRTAEHSFTAKLNRLRDYRRSRSAWLDSLASRETIEVLDTTIRCLSDLSRAWFNTLPADPHDLERVPSGTFADHEKARERAQVWLDGEMQDALKEIEAGMIGRLRDARPWWRRIFGS